MINADKSPSVTKKQRGGSLPEWMTGRVARAILTGVAVIAWVAACSKNEEGYSGPAVEVKEGTTVYDGPKDGFACGEVAVKVTVEPVRAMVERRGESIVSDGGISRVGVPSGSIELKPGEKCEGNTLWLPASQLSELPKQPSPVPIPQS